MKTIPPLWKKGLKYIYCSNKTVVILLWFSSFSSFVKTQVLKYCSASLLFEKKKTNLSRTPLQWLLCFFAFLLFQNKKWKVFSYLTKRFSEVLECCSAALLLCFLQKLNKKNLFASKLLLFMIYCFAALLSPFWIVNFLSHFYNTTLLLCFSIFEWKKIIINKGALLFCSYSKEGTVKLASHSFTLLFQTKVRNIFTVVKIKE